MCERVSVGGSPVDCAALETRPLNATTYLRNHTFARIVHVVGRTSTPPFTLAAIVAANTGYTLNYHSDATAAKFVARMCGSEMADAYRCFTAPAHRADLFRFCALYAQGGLYLDNDIVPLVPLVELYVSDAGVSMGNDLNGGVQMKILAGQAGHPIFKCMLDRILAHVRWRTIPSSSLYISGPLLLKLCTDNHTRHEELAFTYMDTRHAVWPYTGMRTRDTLLAYERPNIKRHWMNRDPDNYELSFRNKAVYTKRCSIARDSHPPVMSYVAPVAAPWMVMIARSPGFLNFRRELLLHKRKLELRT